MMKTVPTFCALAILSAIGAPAFARHVTHSVTPANIDKQPFAFTVRVSDVGEFKQFEIAVRASLASPSINGQPGRGSKTGGREATGSATGSVTIAGDKKPAGFPAVTRVQCKGTQTYTFRVPAADVDRAYFTFTETPQDVRTPFPFPGDYWVFNLSDFVGSREAPKKGRLPSPTFESSQTGGQQ
jgi:hypothetical protein